MFTAATFIVAPQWEYVLPWVGEWLNNVVHLYHGILFGSMEQWTTDPHNVEESPENYAE